MKTVVGLFDNFNDAQQVVQDLVNSGFSRNNISLVANNADNRYGDGTTTGGSAGGDGIIRDTDGSGGPVAEAAGTGAKAGTYVGGALGLLAGLGLAVIPGVGPVLAAGEIATVLGSTALGAGAGAAAGGLLGALVGLGIPEAEAGYYSEGVRRGGSLITASVPDERVDEAVAIMNRHNAVDIDRRGEYYRQGGYSGFDANTQPYSATEIDTYRTQNANIYGTAASTGTTATAATTPMMDTNTATTASSMTPSTTTVQTGESVSIPIVEEQLTVGKREVESGGARIHTRVEEVPVQEQVTLREEHVTVDRRPVDRAVTDADNVALRGGTIEVTERAEQAVVSKEARVVEEVVVGKEATERTETVQDTVRRTDVDVEQVPSTTTTTSTTTTGTTGTTGTGNY
jgi:uncharacterized protein (TIGR02271 family)